MNPEVDPLLNVLTIMFPTILSFYYNVKALGIKRKAFYLLSSGIVCALIMYLNCIGVIDTWVRIIIAIFFTVFYAVLFVESGYVKAIVWGGINLLASYLSEGVSAIFAFLIAGKSYYVLMQKPLLLILIRLGFLGTFFIIISILFHIWMKVNNKRTSDFIIFVPLLVVQIMFFYFCLSSFWNRDMTIGVAFIILGISILNFFLDWLMYVLLNESGKNNLEQSKEGQLRVQLEHQKNREEELLKDQKKAMNIKKMVITGLQDAKKMISQRDGTGATQHLAEITEQFAWKRLYSENRVVDAIVSDKAKECTEKNIRLQTELDIPEKLQVKNAELCVIFANLLDNAIRACERLEGQEKPKDHDCAEIRLAARERGGYLVIREENPFDGMVEDRKQGPLSEHGLGLGIVEQIAQKHEGRLQTEQAEGKFVTVVMLKI